MTRFTVEICAVNDERLHARIDVEAPSADLAGEAAIDLEWAEGADWSNGERTPATGGVRVVSVEPAVVLCAHSSRQPGIAAADIECDCDPVSD